MTFLLDENFPLSTMELLASRGHVGISLAEACGLGVSDEEVFATAQQRSAILLTTDRDFFHTLPLLHPRHNGVVVIALRNPNRRAIQSRLEWFLDSILLPITNKAFLLRDSTYRVFPVSVDS